MKVLVLLSGVATALVTGAATSADTASPRYSPALQQCLEDRPASTTPGQVACVEAEVLRQDARLNRAYRSAMARLAPPQQARLRTARRAWIGFRDADCATRSDPAWGTLSQVDAAFCRLELTAERADHLEAFPPH